MKPISSIIKYHPLTTFLILTFGISFAGFILDLPMVFVFGPSLAGMILVQLTYTREARRDFWRRVIDFKRISVGWYFLIILIFPVLTAISIFLDVLMKGSFPEMPNLGRIFAQPYLFPLVVIEVLIRGPLAEEMGWRGFALNVLLRRWGAFRSSLVIGIIWWAWHLPLFFWSTYGSAHYQWGWFSPMFWGFLLNVIALSFLLTWTYLANRKSILSAILIHLFFNLTLGLVLPFSERVFLFIWVLLFVTVVLITRLYPTNSPAKIPHPVGEMVK